MDLLLTANAIRKSFGARPLFDNLSISIHEGERLGVIGPNGSGKSTFLRILAGLEDPDSGSLSVRKHARIAYVPQEPSFHPAKTAGEVLAEALRDAHLDEAQKAALVNVTLGRAGFTDASVRAGALSGGWRRRLSIAHALALAPDLLLLDEPTNHLDLDGILWLEKLVAGAPFASVVVSHDRYFLENVADEMAEVNPAYPEGLFRAPGNYSAFLEKREEFFEAQSRHHEALANRVRREVEWLRRGPKARGTKAKARIDAARELMGELADANARGPSRAARIDFTASDRRTRRLVTAESISKQIGGRILFDNLSLVLSPGTRVGLAGPNGSGKTTLLRILHGELAPDGGQLERAEGLQVVYFDQDREQLNPAMPLREGLGAHGDTVIYRGRPIHIAGWAKRFLFRAEQLDTPVGRFSGGEKARILIARLMLREADLLLLDEPTNDLDIPTLEVLEESLADFPGAMVLVTHDRFLLDRVATVLLGLDGQGHAEAFADSFQWEQFRAGQKPQKAAKEVPLRQVAAASRKKLSYIENREWEQMEERILEAEQELEMWQRELQAPEVVSDAARLQTAYERLKSAEDRVARLYDRWAELENKLG